MKHDWTADLLTYWDRLRGTRAAPDRRDVSPRELVEKLPNIFILRRDTEYTDVSSLTEIASIAAAKQWHFRLAGTRLCTLYGRELRNTRFLSLWHHDVRSWLSEQLHLSGLDYRPLRLEHTGITLNEKTCNFETLLLPLHETDGTLAWIGSMVALEQPLWLGNDALISNLIGHTTATYAFETDTSLQSGASSAEAMSGMKSVLQVLLDRHHELSSNTGVVTKTNDSPAVKAHAYDLNQVSDTAIASSERLPMDSFASATLSADQISNMGVQHSSIMAASSEPLTVADLIKSVHPAPSQPKQAPAPAKSSHLKLIPGGKN